MDMNYDLLSFRVLMPSPVSRSTAQIRVTTTSLVFNLTAAAELGYPSFVGCLASDDGRYIALQANPPAEYQDITLPFWDDDNKRKGVPLRTKQGVQALRRELGWEDKIARKANGMLFRDQGLLVFDLYKAVPASHKLSHVITLADFPTLNDLCTVLRPKVLALGA